jgi:hypothetical protein
MAKRELKIAHRVDVLDNEAHEGPVKYRWECTCRRDGSWTTRTLAEKNGRRHETKGNAARLPKSDLAPLRSLLKLG